MAIYLFDRTCLAKYMHYLTSAETCPLICLLCAWRFPIMSAKRQRQIQMHPVLARDPVRHETLSCLGLSAHHAAHCCGLKTYTETYGTMTEDVTLDQHQAEFDDWHARVPGGNRNAECWVVQNISCVHHL